MTDENVWRYVRECAAAEQLCKHHEHRIGRPQLVVPSLARNNTRWLAGDVMLIAIGTSDGEVRGALRLSSTLGPAERYQPLTVRLADPLQRSPHVYVWDGFDVASLRHGMHALSSAPAALLAAVQCYALRYDIEQLTAVIDMSWLSQLLELGWSPTPLGVPHEVQGSGIIPVLLDVSETALRRTRTLLSIGGPRLICRGLARRPSSGSDRSRMLS